MDENNYYFILFKHQHGIETGVQKVVFFKGLQKCLH